MLFCKRKECGAGMITEFYMQMSALKWKVKNFTNQDIYVCVNNYVPEESVRIAPGKEELIIDREPQTGTRKTSRRLKIYAIDHGEVEVFMV